MVVLRRVATAGRGSSEPPSLPGAARGVRERRSIAVLRHLDVVLVVLAAAPALALGTPVLGYAVGAGAWVLQRIIAEVDRRWLARAVRPPFGVNLVEAFGRIWLLAGAIVAAGVVGGRADGLTAALTIFIAYSVAFALRLVDGRPTGGPHR